MLAAENRTGLRKQVVSFFKEFGDSSCDTIVAEMVRHGGMKELLGRLGLPDPGYGDDQFTVLRNYLRRRGMDDFRHRLFPRESEAARQRRRERHERMRLMSQETEDYALTPWSGNERRNGDDRRDGDDRRRRSDDVFHDMRFNGERRLRGERRLSSAEVRRH